MDVATTHVATAPKRQLPIGPRLLGLRGRDYHETVVVLEASFGKPLYEYLTQGTKDILYREVVGPDAVHAMLVSNPKGVLDALRPMLK